VATSQFERERYLALLKRTSTQADYEVIARAFENSDISEALAALDLPVLVVHPKDNVWLSPQEAARVASAARNSRTVTIPDAGRLGDPEAGVRAIETFLAGLQRQAFLPEALVLATSVPRLSQRETEVLRLIAAGNSNQQIADQLVLSLRTVERHITNLYAKIGAHGKADATAYALRRGLTK
jgi:DNA-binding NarL/FixJ family response regulator